MHEKNKKSSFEIYKKYKCVFLQKKILNWILNKNIQCIKKIKKLKVNKK